MPGADVLLLGHGTVEDLDDLPPFLSNIRRGRPSPPELVHEIRRRYEAIGGSPLLRISRELAGRVEALVGARVHLAMRFWHPFLQDVLGAVRATGARTLRMIPLAPYSAHVYASELKRLAEETSSEGPLELVSAPNWGTEPLLVDAFAETLQDALARLPDARRARAHVLFSAHSLPLAVVRGGDRYPDEVRGTAEAVAARAGLANPWRIVYQSQGATPDPWLGPDVRESLRAVAQEGAHDVVFCPIGFLSDHIEVLYDLDIEAKALADEAGLGYARTASLNASPALAGAIAAVAARLTSPPGP